MKLAQFSDKIEITSVGSQLIFKGYNTNVKQGIKVKPAASGMKYETNDNPNQIIQGVFDLKHLVQFSKCANLSQTIRIHIKNDFPLIIQCEVATMGVIKLCLAPQSEE